MAIGLPGGAYGNVGDSYGSGQYQASNMTTRFQMDPSDWLAFQQLQAGTPDIFYILPLTASHSLQFTVGTTNIGFGRKQVAFYNIHFLDIDLAPSTVLFDVNGAQAAFRLSDIIISTGAPGPGGVVKAVSQSQYGKAGYYFAAPVNTAGQESRFFAGPLLAPLPGSFILNATPRDVSAPDLDIADAPVNGYDRKLLTFSARTPSNTNGVIGVNVLNAGSGYTPLVDIPLIFTGVGTGAEGFARINANGNVIDAVVTEAGTGYTEPPPVTIGGSAVLVSEIGEGTAFAGYQIYMYNYFNDITLVEAVAIGGSTTNMRPNTLMSGAMYLLPDVPAVVAHDITFYYVSVSVTGARRSDPTGAPSFLLAGGLVA